MMHQSETRLPLVRNLSCSTLRRRWHQLSVLTSIEEIPIALRRFFQRAARCRAARERKTNTHAGEQNARRCWRL